MCHQCFFFREHASMYFIKSKRKLHRSTPSQANLSGAHHIVQRTTWSADRNKPTTKTLKLQPKELSEHLKAYERGSKATGKKMMITTRLILQHLGDETHGQVWKPPRRRLQQGYDITNATSVHPEIGIRFSPGEPLIAAKKYHSNTSSEVSSTRRCRPAGIGLNCRAKVSPDAYKRPTYPYRSDQQWASSPTANIFFFEEKTRRWPLQHIINELKKVSVQETKKRKERQKGKSILFAGSIAWCCLMCSPLNDELTLLAPLLAFFYSFRYLDQCY